MNIFFPLLQRLRKEAGTGKNLGISHFDNHLMYGSVEEDMMLMAEAAYCFIKNPMNNMRLLDCDPLDRRNR